MKGFNVFLSLQVEYLITPFVLYYGERAGERILVHLRERHKDKIIARRSEVAFHTHPHACTPGKRRHSFSSTSPESVYRNRAQAADAAAAVADDDDDDLCASTLFAQIS